MPQSPIRKLAPFAEKAKRKGIQKKRLRNDSWLIHNGLMLNCGSLVRLGFHALLDYIMRINNRLSLENAKE